MKLGRVIGTMVPCERYAGLEGVAMLIVQPLDSAGTNKGQPIVAADSTRMAVAGQVVLYEGGKEAAMALEETFVPVDQCILGIVDEVTSEAWERGDQA